MVSLTRWPWVWATSGSWWCTGKPGVLQFMGSQELDTTDWLNNNWVERHIFLWKHILKMDLRNQWVQCFPNNCKLLRYIYTHTHIYTHTYIHTHTHRAYINIHENDKHWMVPLKQGKGSVCDQEEVIIYKANIVGTVLFLTRELHRSSLYVLMIFGKFYYYFWNFFLFIWLCWVWVAALRVFNYDTVGSLVVASGI